MKIWRVGPLKRQLGLSERQNERKRGEERSPPGGGRGESTEDGQGGGNLNYRDPGKGRDLRKGKKKKGSAKRTRGVHDFLLAPLIGKIVRGSRQEGEGREGTGATGRSVKEISSQLAKVGIEESS